jgi:hypothetical protein
MMQPGSSSRLKMGSIVRYHCMNSVEMPQIFFIVSTVFDTVDTSFLSLMISPTPRPIPAHDDVSTPWPL